MRDLQLYRRLLGHARAYWLHILTILLLGFCSTPLTLLVPLPLKIAVDSVLGKEPLPPVLRGLVPAGWAGSPAMLLPLAAGLLVAIALLNHLVSISGSLLRAWTGQRMILDFRARLFRRAQRLSLAYHDSKGVSDSLYRIQYDAVAVQNVTIEGVIPFITSALTVVAMVYVTVKISWQLCLVALTISPVLVLASQFYRTRLRKRWRKLKRSESEALSVVEEVLGAVRVVKAFCKEDQEEDRFLQRSRESLRTQLKVLLGEGALGLLVGLVTAGGTASVLYIGVWQVQSGTLSLGSLLLVMSYLAQLYDPLKTVGKKVASLQGALASAERAFSLLDHPQEVPQKAHPKRLARARGEVCFEDVSFSYDGEHPILKNVSFEIPPGSRVGIAGRTGAGKTTLVNLLTRFYDPTSGRILLDGVDLRDYRLTDLREQFGIVLQEPVLFSTSIAENIAYARPEAGEEEIVQAAKAAGAHEFIARLPEGYRTLVGERGMRMSGGERQRIALARAFLKDAPLLILDEPTSSVDMKTESEILEAMERLMVGRTTFMIAHRLRTLDGASFRIEIEGGNLTSAAAPSSTAKPAL